MEVFRSAEPKHLKEELTLQPQEEENEVNDVMLKDDQQDKILPQLA